MFVHSLLICVVRVSSSKSNESLATEVSGLRKMSNEEKHDPILLATNIQLWKLTDDISKKNQLTTKANITICPLPYSVW